jgi:hypothetical protein
MIPMPLATWDPPEECKWIGRALMRAMGKLGITTKEAAWLAGRMDEAQWRRQVAGRDGAKLASERVGALLNERRDLKEEWIAEVVKESGAGTFIPNGAMCDFVNAVQVMTLKVERLEIAVSELQGNKRMAKADLPPAEAKEKRA